MSNIKSGKFTITSSDIQKQIDLTSANFTSVPLVNLTTRENKSIYLDTVTTSYFICKFDNVTSDTDVFYVAIEN